MPRQAKAVALCGDSAAVLEERFNVATHGFGVLLSIAGLVLLIIQAGSIGRAGSLAASVVYGTALIFLFLFSTLHHAASRPRRKQCLLALDHCGIYLLIAGTYTPFCLILPTGKGMMLASFVWGIAAVGIAMQLAAFVVGRSETYERFAFLLYLAMGWMPLIWVKDDIWNALATGGLALLIAGGVAYSAGVIFYLWKSLRYSHAVWHLFVVAGSALQFFSIFYFVVPALV